MQRYFLEGKIDKEQAEQISLKDEYHHIVRVMRRKEGDKLVLIYNKQSFIYQIFNINETDERVDLRFVKAEDNDHELPVHVHLIQGIPKGDKLDFIVQKSTEFGVSSLTLFDSERTIVKLNQKKTQSRLKRYRKIAKEAAEQSYRAHIPEIIEPVTLDKLLIQSQTYDLKFIAYEDEAKTDQAIKLAEHFDQIKPGMDIGLVIGPEGGLSEREVSHLKQAGFIPVRLGKRILRTESANLYFLSAISYFLEEKKS